ncbi:MAG TPA: hypothetical protein DDX19_22795 [Rhodopirellula baltica]|uniref:Uncharacterized protein n=1 Tax=Rhodopirellula baltica (strain DSM 10527 / NCIMB 13988 / SH1) TaxID=243090 RepID=Q7UVU3_RHOBA|nr:hypothetical protein [Rhodopirellula baltica]CAD72628.1 hypothetical protein RB2436 [Rhodopirellula baltica SH 1]HBE65528.1 hypothetical protein [Rhodopirellula baltica]
MSLDPQLLARLSTDPAKRIDEVIAHYRRERQPVELFEALKMKSRLAHGLPMIADPDEPLAPATSEADKQRERELEEDLLDACRQAGAMLIQDGRIAEGWMYLRPTGDIELAKRLLEDIEINDDNYDEMTQVLLHENVDLRRGYNAVLKHQGTCNSITLYDQAIAARSRKDRQIAAECLLTSFYNELLSLVRDDFQNRGPDNGVSAEAIEADAAKLNLGELIAKYKWILGGGGYHLDTTHLSSTVRFATVIDDREMIDQALQLCQYGRRLPSDFQYPGEEPFVDFYPAHSAFFSALLGQSVDTALRMFEQKARTVDVNVAGAGAIETYIDLLDRVGRPAEALRAAIELFPDDVPVQRVLPELLAMARRAKQAGDTSGLDALEQFCFGRSDLLAVAAIAAEKA